MVIVHVVELTDNAILNAYDRYSVSYIYYGNKFDLITMIIANVSYGGFSKLPVSTRTTVF